MHLPELVERGTRFERWLAADISRRGGTLPEKVAYEADKLIYVREHNFFLSYLGLATLLEWVEEWVAEDPELHPLELELELRISLYFSIRSRVR